MEETLDWNTAWHNLTSQVIAFKHSVISNQTLWINLAVLLSITIASYLILRALLALATRRLNTLYERKHGKIYGFAAEMLGNTSRLLIFAFSLMLGLHVIKLADRWESNISHGWFFALSLQIAIWLDMGIRLWMSGLSSSTTASGRARNPVTTIIVGVILRGIVWVMLLLSVLSNLGVNITAMVASLGVGGIAIALAVQTVLSDVFASLSIGLDKPFEVGDFVVFGEVAGTIESIGLKTTRIRSLSGEQIVCSNATLQSQILHNYKRMGTRRIVFKFGITYDTPPEKVREVSSVVRRIIEQQEKVRFDRAHFTAFDESQLTFEVVYIVQAADFNLYMDIQQEINLALMQELRSMDVKFAFPSRSVELIGGNLPDIKVTSPDHEIAQFNARKASR
ncbi:mechanosensitive ion channel family protein [Azomonas macrocytogenes]|uniref:Small-conductance mechanosensitive channel n=1 Tax=Azomonas macrocytogenes TaxID=69962 RepID=A0A839T2N7_AZOMA|nr:mechanosensitive ion channel family protein [Azomonas macrocytogenes]MBB3103368.1 small-conductance mechanosensitive channel [Azomonas macrocytogenes]